jgi:menaquinone-dependent protoporphyrinogen oxidase
MRILIAWGSKRGGTEGIARLLGETLESEGYKVELLPAAAATRAAEFDGVVVGGALYANRWHRAARRFVTKSVNRLRSVPVWLFSSGPLNDSAEKSDISPTKEVRVLMERIGAQGHATFGGRLLPDARGFPASAMAKKHAGDWRSHEHIRAWALEIARALPVARPRVAIDHPGRSPFRLLVHALAGWAACALVMACLLSVTRANVALAIHAALAPIIFVGVARHYFHVPGAREPLQTAFVFVVTTALLDLVVIAGLLQHSLAMFTAIAGTWFPLVLVFLATWATGEILMMVPEVRPGHAPLGVRADS